MTDIQYTPLPDAQRAFILRDYLARCVTNGARVEVQLSPYDAQVCWPKPQTNHVLHLLVTLFTFGLWAPVWILIAVTQEERRMVVAVDEWGRVNQVGPK